MNILTRLSQNPAAWMWVYVIALLVMHGPSLGVWYVQDDAHAYLSAHKWLSFYLSIAEHLQYRPNAWLLTHILDKFAPDEAWPLRVFGLCMTLIIAIAFKFFVQMFTRDRVAGLIAGLFLLTAPGMFSNMTLYLASAMTGLGLLSVILSLIAALVWFRYRFRVAYAATIIGFIGCLTSYEAAIIALPLMYILCVIESPRDWFKTGLWFIPHGIIALIYLWLRGQGIEASNAAGVSTWYGVNIGMNIIFNFARLMSNALAIPYLQSYIYVPDWVVVAIVPFVALAAWGARRAQRWPLFWLSSAFLILGPLPFATLPDGGISLHYVFYTLPAIAGFLVIMVIGLPLGRFIAIAALVYCMVVTHSMYNKRILTEMAYIGRDMVTQFEATPQPKKQNIAFLNLSEWLAWRIHFGSSINIGHRDAPYNFFFHDYPSYPEKLGGVYDASVDATYIFIDMVGHDMYTAQRRLRDVTDLVNLNAPSQNWVGVPRGPQPALTLTARGESLTITLTNSDGTKNECRAARGKDGDMTIAIPPRVWRADDAVTLTGGASSTIRVAKTFRPMVYNDSIQSCDTPLITQ